MKLLHMPGQQVEDPIVEVWASNVDAEFKKIRSVIKTYNYVSMVSFVIEFKHFTLYLFSMCNKLN